MAGYRRAGSRWRAFRPAGSAVGGWAGGPSLWLLLLPCALGAAGEECGGARPRPARVVLLSVPAFPWPARPVTLALVVLELGHPLDGQLASRSGWVGIVLHPYGK